MVFTSAQVYQYFLDFVSVLGHDFLQTVVVFLGLARPVTVASGKFPVMVLTAIMLANLAEADITAETAADKTIIAQIAFDDKS